MNNDTKKTRMKQDIWSFITSNLSHTVQYGDAKYEIIGYKYHAKKHVLCVLTSTNHIEKERDFGFQISYSKNPPKRPVYTKEKVRKTQKSHFFDGQKNAREALETLENRDDGVINTVVHQLSYDTIDTIKIHYSQNPNSAPTFLPARRPRYASICLGFDSEWQERTDRKGRVVRRILCEQWSFRDSAGKMYVWFVFHITDKRFKLREVLKWLFSDCAGVLGLSDLPKRVDICLSCFNGLADLSIFSDRQWVYKHTNTIRNKLITMEKPVHIKYYDDNRHVVSKFCITLRDCSLLAPAKVALADLGDAMKIPKIDIPKEQKGQMEYLMNAEPEKFFCYAAQDAVITLSWIEYVLRTMDGNIPVTAASYGAQKIKNGIIKQLHLDPAEFEEYWCGVRTEVQSSVDSKGRQKKVKTALPTATSVLNAANECYYGGRNECFFFGCKDGIWYDYDVRSAYPNAMCLLEDVDYYANAVLFDGDLWDISFDYTDYLFARIRFKFPPTAKYPCLPVRDCLGRGLIFPLEGECWASAPELKTALLMGAQIYVYEGYIQPKHAGRRSLAKIETELINDRLRAKKEYGKGSPAELLLKEIANSGYGKMGQGLSGKRAFSSKAGSSVDVDPSPITAAPQAALITGLVRAAVSEAMWKLQERGYVIASVTTDGFLTNAPENVMKEICKDGLLKIFSENLQLVTGEKEVFETKHACYGVFCMKTRGQVGFKAVPDMEVPVAKAGYKPPSEKKKDREFLIMQFLERTEEGLVSEYLQLPSARDCVVKKMDYVGKNVRKHTYWDFDYKRVPDESTIEEYEIEIGGKKYKHVFYDTLPWRSYVDFANRAESLRKRRVPVKAKEDVKEVCKTIRIVEELHGCKKRIRGSVDRTYAVSILRGIRQGKLVAEWLEGKSGAEICKVVQDAFCGRVKLTPNDWKNAGRPTRKALGLAGAEEYLEKLGLNWNLTESLEMATEALAA